MTYGPKPDTPPLGRPPQKYKRPDSNIVSLVVVAITLVTLIWGGPEIYSGIDESGWIPHTKVMTVAVKSSTWIVGEYKNCKSFAIKPVQEIVALECDNTSETHDLTVKFWGVNNTERQRLWNCERVEDDAFTCKLQ